MSDTPITANDNLTPKNSGDGQTTGLPTTPGIARGQVANTSVNFSNNNLAHVCDITGQMKYYITWVSFQVSEAIEAIRIAIENLFASASASPFGDAVRSAIQYIKAKVEVIKGYLKKATEAVSAVKQFITEINSLIVYIATLPAKAAAMLKQCLVDAKNSLTQAISDGVAISKVSDTINQSITDTQSSLSSTENVVSVSTPTSNNGKP
jgi:hypothetical protein